MSKCIKCGNLYFNEPNADAEMCFRCEMEEKNAKIADLEAKLAESEKDRLMWQEMYKSADRLNKGICETDIYPLQEENTKLKQQLAEKEKEIEQQIKELEGETK